MAEFNALSQPWLAAPAGDSIAFPAIRPSLEEARGDGSAVNQGRASWRSGQTSLRKSEM